MSYTNWMANPNIWHQLTLIVAPVAVSVITGSLIIYGQISAMRVEVDVITKQIAEHMKSAAHGTVRENLATHELRLKALETEIAALIRHAEEGRRYTLKDARDDQTIHNGQHKVIDGDHKDFKARLLRLESIFIDPQRENH